ncbi:monocarboxylate transporter 14-like [Babylonia areolata]|uniref:monocarboxylate transporter 14-like n=1 Tax=Babylonia areolata TaxID=304850 RepID=UPI003FD6BC39
MTVLGASREDGSREVEGDTGLTTLHDIQDDTPSPSPPHPHSPTLGQAAEEEIGDAGEPLLETGTGNQKLPPEVTQTEAEMDEKDEEEEDDGVPYDRGWAWMVVFGLFVNFSLIAGYMKSSGLIFVELLQEFHASAAQTTLLFAIRAGVFSFSGFCVMNILLGKFQARTLVLTGGILVSLSAILSSQVNNLTLLICVNSVLSGVGLGMTISPGEVLVGRYFRKRRSLALSLAKCGASIGNVAIPPLLTLLLTQYGLSGALLVFGGICLHSMPAALLHTPLSHFTARRRPSSQGSKPGRRDPGHRTHGVTGWGDRCSDSLDRLHVSSSGTRPDNDEELQHVQQKTSIVVETVAPDESAKDNISNRHPDYLRSRSCSPKIVTIEECDLGTLASSHPEIRMLSTSFPRPLLKRALSESPESRSRAPVSGETTSVVLQALSESSVVQFMSVSSLDVIPATPLPLLSDTETPAQRAAMASDTNNNHNAATACTRALRCLLHCPRNFVSLFDFSLFREPLFLLLMAYITFSPFLNITLDYLPALAAENGVPESQSALLISVIGGLDFVSRLTCGFVADLRVVRISTMIAAAFLVLALTTQFVGFMSTFPHFVVLAVLQGLFGGVGNCLFAVLVIEFVGLHNMGKAIGFCQLASGVSMAVTYPFLGYIRDVTGSYAMSYRIIGIGALLAALFLAAEGPVRRLQERRRQHKQQDSSVPEI